MCTILSRWEFNGVNKQELFFKFALAYLDSSIHHFKSMVSGSIPKTYIHALAGELLFITALENFFRGSCLEKYEKDGFPRKHNLKSDYIKYKELHKDKELDFNVDMDEIVRQLPQRPDSIYSRYHTDRKGKRWSNTGSISPEIWAKKLPAVKEDFDRLIPVILQKTTMDTILP